VERVYRPAIGNPLPSRGFPRPPAGRGCHLGGFSGISFPVRLARTLLLAGAIPRHHTTGDSMTERSGCDLLSIEGEIVEIFQRAGRRVARIVLSPQIVCEVPAEGFADAHLGDRVLVQGHVTIEQVAVVPAREGV
jgi:hypothetical protein